MTPPAEGVPTGVWLAANGAIGLSLALDAALATVAQFRRFSKPRQVLVWGALIGLTHWFFPMAGFAAAWFLAATSAWRRVVWGCGAALLAWHVAHVVRDATRPGYGTAPLGTGFHSGREILVAVLAVSWDALVSGPGKTAVADTWTTVQIWLSFPVVGLVVFLVVAAATFPALWLHRRWRAGATWRPETFARLLVAGVALEIALFTGFASLAASKAVLPGREFEPAALLLATLVWTATLGVLAWTHFPRIVAAQRELTRRILEA